MCNVLCAVLLTTSLLTFNLFVYIMMSFCRPKKKCKLVSQFKFLKTIPSTKQQCMWIHCEGDCCLYSYIFIHFIFINTNEKHFHF